MDDMIDETLPVFVGVFASRPQAERAATDLLSEGFEDENLGLIWSTPEGIASSGLLADTPDRSLAELLSEVGVRSDAANYYEREIAAGLCLLLVRVGGGRGVAQAMMAIGKNCGSIRFPEVGDFA
jgi:hypothetical protein